jgi:hypothetical protein
MLGFITAYTHTDAVGRITLDDGTELRFGASAMRDCLPAIGLRVRVGETKPHPLGGLRALEVHRAETDDAAYAEKAEAFLRAAREEEAANLARSEHDREELSRRVKADPPPPDDPKEPDGI